MSKIFLPMEEFIKCYTDEGQDIFNEILDNVEEFLADVGIYPESEEDKKNVIPR